MPKQLTALVPQIPPEICTVMSMAASLETLMTSGKEKRELKTKILLGVTQLTGAQESSLLVEPGEIGSLRDQWSQHAEGTGRAVQLKSVPNGPQGLSVKMTELQSQGSFLFRLSIALNQFGVSISSARGEGQWRDRRTAGTGKVKTLRVCAGFNFWVSFSIVVCMALCSAFVLETVWTIQGCFCNCWAALTQSQGLFCSSPHQWGGWGCTGS